MNATDSLEETCDEDILAEAVGLPPAEREAFLTRACAGDMEQRQRLAELARSYDEAAGFLDLPAVPRPTMLPREAPGDLIDRYKLIERIGDGGCGVVWQAEQQEPLRRTVALKVIKLGLKTREVVSRFESERQVLALMDHPNIARVFDAGVTSTGRPYFVMEFVSGVSITKYCDDHDVSLAQRLELFATVCDAVQHAHQKGIVHQDLKPSNILIAEFGGAAVPKVIDFGIAKAIQGRPNEPASGASSDFFIGTPIYMSPEQADADGQDVDTRSDVYTLGVLLCELLMGRRPFDPRAFSQGSVDDIRRHIRDTPPAKPSSRWQNLAADERTRLAQQRGITSRRLARQLSADLDWVVLRCLEKDRARRYDSVSALAADIRRYLRHMPVAARPATALYVARKAIRRHRFGFTAAAAVLGATIIGAGISTWQAIRATRAEHEQSRLLQVESEIRHRAEAQELIARRRAYVADMNLLQRALENDNLGLARRLLERHRPKPGEIDLRGWEWRYLWQLCQSEATDVVARMSHPVSWLSLSADGRWLAGSQEEQGIVSVWNVATHEEIPLPAGAGSSRAVFSPISPVLAIAFTVSKDAQAETRLKLYNFETRETLAEWTLGGPPALIHFSADGREIVTASSGRLSRVERWSVADGTKLGSLPASGGPTISFTGDMALGAREVLRDGRARVAVFSVATGAERWSVDASDENVSALVFSPDGTVLASSAGTSGSAIRLWDVKTGALLKELSGHQTYVTGLAFHANGRQLVSASKDQTLRLWDVAEGRLLRTFRGHELEVHSLVLMKDNRSFFSGSKDGVVLRWSPDQAPISPVMRVSEPVANWQFTPDSKGLVALDALGQVVLRHGRDLAGTQVVFPSGPLPAAYMVAGFGRDLVSLGLGRDAPLIASVAESGEVRVFDWAHQRLLTTLSTSGERISVVGFTEKGRKLFLLYRDSTQGPQQLHEWDLAAGKETRTWTLGENRAQQFLLSPDGRHFVARAPDGSTSVLDLDSRVERTVPSRGVMVNSLAFSPRHDLVVVTSGAGWARVWDARSGRQVADLSGFVLGVHSSVFTPDGERLIIGSGGDEGVRVWDVHSFEPLVTLSVEGSRFTSTLVSPDGNLIGSRNNFGRLYVWRAPSWAEIAAAEQRTAK